MNFKVLQIIITLLFTLQAWLPGLPVSPQTADAQGFEVRIHPGTDLRVGDVVSLEVIAPEGVNLDRASLTARVIRPNPLDLGKTDFFYGYGGHWAAALRWAWDTSEASPGRYSILFSIPSKQIRWQQEVRLGAAPTGPRPQWKMVETGCCVIHYITGTDAERDIQRLAKVIEDQSLSINARFGKKDFPKKLQINLFPRVLGQSGFANDQVYVSYRDENYANSNAVQLIHHELVHRIDSLQGGNYRPTFLVEGVAVSLSGGHYRKENVPLRAAALVQLGSYLPLPQLIDNFYPSQHESGYIEAGAFVDFLVQTWGWERFNRFYRGLENKSDLPASAAIDTALQSEFGLSLQQMEHRFLDSLSRYSVPPDVLTDVDLTIRLYDLMRRYQKLLDPSAYFEQAWLPDAGQMREKGITADYLSSPDAPENRQIEKLLYAAGVRFAQGDYQQTSLLLSEIETKLNEIEREQQPGEEILIAGR